MPAPQTRAALPSTGQGRTRIQSRAVPSNLAHPRNGDDRAKITREVPPGQPTPCYGPRPGWPYSAAASAQVRRMAVEPCCAHGGAPPACPSHRRLTPPVGKEQQLHACMGHAVWASAASCACISSTSATASSRYYWRWCPWRSPPLQRDHLPAVRCVPQARRRQYPRLRRRPGQAALLSRSQQAASPQQGCG